MHTSTVQAPPEPVEAPWTLTTLGVPDVALTVYGTPGPQGSKKARAIYRGSKAKGTLEFTGRVAVQESSQKVGPWRNAVASVARVAHAGRDPLDGPLIADMVFTWAKPKSAPKWNIWPTTYPDLSKLARSTEDALSKIVWADDSRVVAYRRLEKVYVGSTDPDTLSQAGAVIRVWRLPNWMIEERRLFTTGRQP